MLNFIGAASDAFTDPKNPWYYITGGIFLALIVVAIVAYIIWEKKHAAKMQDDGKAQGVAENADANSEEHKDEQIANSEEPAVTEQAENNEEPPVNSEPEKSEEPPVESESVEAEEKPAENEPEKAEEPTEKEESEKAEEPLAESEPEKTEEGPKEAQAEEGDKIQSEKSENEDEPKPEKAKPAAKKTTKPKTGTATAAKKGKAFIDSVISTVAIQPVYNELKNTLLSYPGMKAKLNKDGEDFIFGTDIKASIKLDGKELKLYLAAEADDMKSYNGVAADGDLHTAIGVPESSIDNAEKAIVYVMNVAMLTRNTKHKHVDYVKKAIEAKQRAKKK